MKTPRNTTAATVAVEVKKSKIAAYWESKQNEGIIHNMRAVLK